MGRGGSGSIRADAQRTGEVSGYREAAPKRHCPAGDGRGGYAFPDCQRRAAGRAGAVCQRGGCDVRLGALCADRRREPVRIRQLDADRHDQSALCGRFRRAEPRRHGAENRQKPGRMSGPFRLCERHGRRAQSANQKCGGSGRADSGTGRGRRGGRQIRSIYPGLCRAAGKLRDDRRHDSRYVGKHGAKLLCRRHCGPGMWRDSALLCYGQHHRRG